MFFTESIPLHKAKYILSLPDDIIREEMYDPEELQTFDSTWNTETYIKNIKNFCKRVIANNGTVKQTYKHSNRLLDCGRLFVKGFGIQSMQYRLRGFLCSDNYSDFDMVNAHPTILKWMAHEWFSNEQFGQLDKYIECRDKLLKSFKASKRDILVAMNSDKPTGNPNLLVSRLDIEFKRIQNLLWQSGKYEKFKNENVKNPKGSFLNTVLCILENEILQNAIGTVEASVLMFDGFMMGNDRIPDNIIELLDESSKEYGVRWLQKAHDNTIQLDEDLLADIDIEQHKDYETAKIEFEEKYFVIKNPLGFGEETSKGLIVRNRVDFSTLTEPDIYYKEGKKGVEERNLFKDWLKDKDRRQYDQIDFIPTLGTVPYGIYNTFKGFAFSGTCCPMPDAVKHFLNHINLLVNYEVPSFDYVVGYLAHMLQFSTELPEVALLFKSSQGVGKDLMVDFIQKILGHDMVYRTAKLDEIFDKFNGALKNKILLQLNEVQGSDGFAKKENLKDLITTKTLNINEKNLKPYTLTNYMRVIIFSNNLTPIEIPHDDRRYCVFKSGQKKSRPYYKNLVKLLHDDDAIESIANYLMTYDLNDFDIKERPETQAYKDMKEANVHPLYQYLYEEIVEEKYMDDWEGFKIHKKTKDIYIKPNEVQSCFKYFLENQQQTYIKHDYRTLKLLLADLGIYQKQMKFAGGSPTTYYFFPRNSADFEEMLKNKGFEPQEVEEL